MMKRILTIGLLAFLLVPVGARAQSTICSSSTCSTSEVGPFMVGISAECGNAGTCELSDIMIVFGNIGNYIVSIVGALVLLMYVVGGIFMMTQGMYPQGRERGITIIKQATFGLLIVLFAFAGVQSLEAIIRTGNLSSDGETYVSCNPDGSTDGEACNFNKVCRAEQCITECEAQHPTAQVTDTEIIWYTCTDNTGAGLSSGQSIGGCEANLCPGPANVQCCQITATR